MSKKTLALFLTIVIGLLLFSAFLFLLNIRKDKSELQEVNNFEISYEDRIGLEGLAFNIQATSRLIESLDITESGVYDWSNAREDLSNGQLQTIKPRKLIIILTPEPQSFYKISQEGEIISSIGQEHMNNELRVLVQINEEWLPESSAVYDVRGEVVSNRVLFALFKMSDAPEKSEFNTAEEVNVFILDLLREQGLIFEFSRASVLDVKNWLELSNLNIERFKIIREVQAQSCSGFIVCGVETADESACISETTGNPIPDPSGNCNIFTCSSEVNCGVNDPVYGWTGKCECTSTYCDYGDDVNIWCPLRTTQAQCALDDCASPYDCTDPTYDSSCTWTPGPTATNTPTPGGGGATNTPTPTSTGTPTPSPTPAPGQCAAPTSFNGAPSCEADGDVSITYTWNAVSGASTYRLVVDDDPGFTSPVYDQDVGGVTSQIVPNLTSGVTWYGRVRVNTSSRSCTSPSTWSSTSDLLDCGPVGCSINIDDVNLTGVGDSSLEVVTVNMGTISSVSFTSADAGVATVTSPDGSAPFETTVTATGLGSTTYTATATDSLGSICLDTANISVGNATAWWQVVGGDVIAGNASGVGSIVSQVPTAVSCSPPACEPYLIRESNSYTGVPSLGSSSSNYGAGSPSSTNWEATNAPYLSAKPYSYSFFEARIPSTIVPTPVAGPTVQDTVFESGGVSFGGYYWYKYDGAAGDLSLDAADGVVNLGTRKVILFVENSNLILNAKIAVTDGLGAMYIVADQDVTIDASVGDASAAANSASLNPDIESLIFADGQIMTGTLGPDGTGNGQDLQLYVRGALAGLGLDAGGNPANDGVVFERDLADNSGFPAEIVEFAPDMALSWPPYLTSKSIIWREVAP